MKPSVTKRAPSTFASSHRTDAHRSGVRGRFQGPAGNNGFVALLLCDLDDTLADRQAMFDGWAESLLLEVGREASEAAWLIDLDDRGYTPRDEFFAQVVERFLPDESVETFAERYHRDYVGSFRCTSEVAAALDRARHAGFKIAIVTNGATRAQSGKLAASGLGELVDACCISEEEGFWKPAPELFRIAAERCNESIDGAWMIGDNPVTDIGGADSLGIRTAWMRLERTWPEHLEYRPTLQADSLPEAVETILSYL
jgi:HAD superfamily hydrolase (TIGR01549 family)